MADSWRQSGSLKHISELIRHISGIQVNRRELAQNISLTEDGLVEIALSAALERSDCLIGEEIKREYMDLSGGLCILYNTSHLILVD